MNLAIIDTETIRWSSEINGGFDNLQAFGLTLLSIGIPQSDGTLDYALFSPYASLPQFPTFDFNFISREQATSALERADRIISFNGDNFDFSILQSAKFKVENWRHKSFDLLTIFVRAAGHRISLDNLATSQFQESKSFDSSKRAVEFWRSGLELLRGWSGSSNLDQTTSNQFCRQTAKHLFQTVIDYCKQDVLITFQLYQHLLQHKQLSYYDQRADRSRTLDLSDLVDRGFYCGYR